MSVSLTMLILRAKKDMAIFHFSSPHWETGRLFSCDQDFIAGVNTLAIAVVLFNVRLLCFCLMDNHIHIILEGDAVECEKCYKWIMLRLAQMAGIQKYKKDKLDLLDIKPVEITSRKQFANEVAYILRNPYKARMGSPYSYKWNSSDVYFNPWLLECKGEQVGAIPVSKARELFHTRHTLPPHYEHSRGRILNRCFVDYKRAEKLLGSDLNLFDTIRLWDLEGAVAMTHGAEEKITFTDSELSAKIEAMCRKEYHTESLELLDRKTLLTLARAVSRRFGAGKKQLSRLLGISPEVLDAVL